MSWNQDVPDNATKIRVYPQVLTDNFKAVQAGDISLQYRATNFIDRSTAPEAPSLNPLRNDDTMILFSKNDGSNTELFVENDQNPADIIQLTQGNAMGSDNTNIIGSSITINSVSSDAISSWGYFSAAGALLAGKNMNAAANVSTGIWTITTTAVMNNAQVGISCTAFRPPSQTPAGINVVIAPSIAANVITLRIETKERDGDHSNIQFYVLIVGGV